MQERADYAAAARLEERHVRLAFMGVGVVVLVVLLGVAVAIILRGQDSIKREQQMRLENLRRELISTPSYVPLPSIAAPPPGSTPIVIVVTPRPARATTRAPNQTARPTAAPTPVPTPAPTTSPTPTPGCGLPICLP